MTTTRFYMYEFEGSNVTFGPYEHVGDAKAAYERATGVWPGHPTRMTQV